MNTLVICRIADLRLRKKIHARLKNYGFSPAQGIFECDFTPVEFIHMQKYLQAVSLSGEDCLIMYPLCAVCQKKRLFFGVKEEKVSADEPWLIF